jgi:hypothetical protein
VFRVLTTLVLFLLPIGHAQAADNCSGSAQGSKEYAKATVLVIQLPEFKAWAKSHRFPVAFGESMDEKVSHNGHCYWSVSVYADRGSRLEMWNAFLVSAKGREILVEDKLGEDPMPLTQWRKRGF